MSARGGRVWVHVQPAGHRGLGLSRNRPGEKKDPAGVSARMRQERAGGAKTAHLQALTQKDKPVQNDRKCVNSLTGY